jgi:3-oxoacyl-[acyl-carrier protein] reductase
MEDSGLPWLKEGIMTLKGKVAFVSGAARGRGNGRAIALTFAREGADVVTADIRSEEAQAVAQEVRGVGRKAMALTMDIGVYGQVVEGFSEIEKELGTVDILINNAAIMTNVATLSKMDQRAWDQEIRVNLSGAFYCIQKVFDGMAEKGWGRIINISSVAGMMGGYGQAGYASSKAGLIGLTKTVALEGARSGITANAVTLGIIGTDAFYDIPEKVQERVKKRVAMAREGDPRDVAEMVAFLASDKAKYITGANIMLTGGLDLFVF